MNVEAIDHVQLAMPPGGEAQAREFYQGLLGIPEVPKPPELAARGGCWFEHGVLRVHLGVEAEFRAARKAHPGFRVRDLAALVAQLEAHGCPCLRDGGADRRVYVDDPFGNRIELIAADTAHRA
jgi:catechol 2,3-dioxygenase-like lactoylglutathione lyase family enzyme